MLIGSQIAKRLDDQRRNFPQIDEVVCINHQAYIALLADGYLDVIERKGETIALFGGLRVKVSETFRVPFIQTSIRRVDRDA